MRNGSKIVNTLPNREVTIVMSEFNAKVGNEYVEEDLRNVIGKYNVRNRNNREGHLILFVIEHSFFITNTRFQHQPSKLYRMISLEGRYTNQIDYN